MTANPADPGCRLIVFAKAPEPGKVKTRLIPALGAEGAADLHRRLVRRAIRAATDAALGTVELWCAPEAQHPFFSECHRDFGVSLRSQGKGDLGERMERAFEATLARSPRAILIGSDIPALHAGHLRDADRALREGYDCVLGPAEDGGYVLIGLVRPEAELFQGIRWGGPDVLAETRRRIARLQRRCCELPLLWDVDRPEDLRRLRGNLRAVHF
jgi:uncharacterized protein